MKVVYDPVLNEMRTEISDISELNNDADYATTGDLESAVTAESDERKSADSALQNSLDSEALARENADDSLSSMISDEVTNREASDSALDVRIDNEMSDRISSDSNLQSQIDELKNQGIIKNSVDTYADLLLVDTSTLNPNDMYIVEKDETHGGHTSLYSWSGTAWVYAGDFSIELDATAVHFTPVSGILSTNVQSAIQEVFNHFSNFQSKLKLYRTAGGPAYTITAPEITSLYDGLQVQLSINDSNWGTTSPTLKINNGQAVIIMRGQNNPLVLNELGTNTVQILVYSSANNRWFVASHYQLAQPGAYGVVTIDSDPDTTDVSGSRAASQTAVKTLSTRIGSLGSLLTVSKDSVVNAINEVFNKMVRTINGKNPSIYGGVTLTATDVGAAAAIHTHSISQITSLQGIIDSLQANINSLRIQLSYKVDQAPMDGKIYGMRNGEWVEITQAPTGDILMDGTDVLTDNGVELTA